LFLIDSGIAGVETAFLSSNLCAFSFTHRCAGKRRKGRRKKDFDQSPARDSPLDLLPLTFTVLSKQAMFFSFSNDDDANTMRHAYERDPSLASIIDEIRPPTPSHNLVRLIDWSKLRPVKVDEVVLWTNAHFEDDKIVVALEQKGNFGVVITPCRDLDFFGAVETLKKKVLGEESHGGAPAGGGHKRKAEKDTDESANKSANEGESEGNEWLRTWRRPASGKLPAAPKKKAKIDKIVPVLGKHYELVTPDNPFQSLLSKYNFNLSLSLSYCGSGKKCYYKESTIFCKVKGHALTCVSLSLLASPLPSSPCRFSSRWSTVKRTQ
jgi:hypothetical protein